MNLIEIVSRVIVANELGGDSGLAYRFSDPDGVKSGKSGWSFGSCQFDLLNNGMAPLCLKECGFSDSEISALKAQTFRSMPLANSRLAEHWKIVDQWDARQISECVSRVTEMGRIAPFEFLDDKAFIMACDYHNQFFISKGGQFFNWAKALGRPISDYDIYKFKLGQPWGIKRPDDVKRRYANVLKVIEGVA